VTTLSTGATPLLQALQAYGGALGRAAAEADERQPGARSGAARRTGPLSPPQLAASGPRAAGREAEYELLLEMIYEGSRLHYGPRRLLAPDDPDLALLLGDQLYALGLSRLAALGDLPAVCVLADTISLLAEAQAAGDPELAAAIWEAGAAAVGWGSSRELELAQERARRGDPGAAAALSAASDALRRGPA
jgi:hypothetical protein